MPLRAGRSRRRPPCRGPARPGSRPPGRPGRRGAAGGTGPRRRHPGRPSAGRGHGRRSRPRRGRPGRAWRRGTGRPGWGRAPGGRSSPGGRRRPLRHSAAASSGRGRSWVGRFGGHERAGGVRVALAGRRFLDVHYTRRPTPPEVMDGAPAIPPRSGPPCAPRRSRLPRRRGGPSSRRRSSISQPGERRRTIRTSPSTPSRAPGTSSIAMKAEEPEYGDLSRPAIIAEKPNRG